MKITKKQLKQIIKEEKAKLMEMPMGERFSHGIFNGNYLYDILIDEIEDYLNTAGAEGLARDEADRMELALNDAIKALIGDYVL